jgi:sec-independent protein translocase protein TatB
MFDLGWSKVLILAVVAIVVVGPKELPSLLRAVGQFIAQLRRHAAEFRTQFDEAMKSTELDQIRRDVQAIKTDATESLRGIERSIEKDVADAKTSVDKAFEAADAQTANMPAESSANGPATGATSLEPLSPAAPMPVAMPEPPGFATPAMPVAPAVTAEPVMAPLPAALSAKTGT